MNYEPIRVGSVLTPRALTERRVMLEHEKYHKRITEEDILNLKIELGRICDVAEFVKRI